MRNRDAALAAVQHHLSKAADTQGAEALFTDAALRHATELAAATDPDTDLTAAYLLGMFHWLRHQARPGRTQRDFTEAARFLAPVHRAQPDAVPGPLRRHYAPADGPAADSDAVRMEVQAAELLSAHGRTGELPLLLQALTLFRSLTAATPAAHPDHAAHLSNLAVVLQMVFEQTGEIEVLVEAVDLGRTAVEATPTGRPASAENLNNLAIGLRMLSERTGRIEVLVEAADVARAAVEALPTDHPERSYRLNNLAIVLRRLFEQTGEIERLAEAFDIAQAAVDATPADHPNHATSLFNYAGILLRSFERTGQVELLVESVEMGRAAIADLPTDHPEFIERANNLALALRMLYEQTGEADWLDKAIGAGRFTADATSSDHPEYARSRSNLAAALYRLAERTGETGLLVESVDLGRAALDATSSDHPGYVQSLNGVALALSALFERTGETELLVEAVGVGRATVAATSPGHPEHAVALSTMVLVLLRLFGRTGETEWAVEAVDTGRAAVAATIGYPSHATNLHNLVAALLNQFRRTGETAWLIEAVDTGRAVVATPFGSPNPTAGLNLAAALQMLSERTGEIELLVEAVDIGRAMVDATPFDHPARAVLLTNHGIGLRMLSEHTGESGQLAEAVRCIRQVGESAAAGIGFRIRAYGEVAILTSRQASDGQEALAAAEAVAALLPQIAPGALTRSDREHQLTQVDALAALVAASALAAGRAERAVELLELTRGILVADTVGARSSDLSRLREAAPGLAAEFETLRARREDLDERSRAATDAVGMPAAYLDDAVQAGRAGRAGTYLADARRDAQGAWETLIGRIRAVDGFADFLTAPGIDELTAQAHDGPVVFVYTSPTGSDALILTGDPAAPVRVVPLGRFTQDDAVGQINRFLDAQRATADGEADPVSRRAAQGEILEVLAWLWDTVTEPVLTAVGMTSAPPQGMAWPRLWWCPVGILSRLPLHAAGHHADLLSDHHAHGAEPRTVLDRVVSSYTTTVRGLAYARAQSPRHTGTARASTVIVAVPDAPDAPPLEGVSDEAATLEALIPGAYLLPHPVRETVLAALPHHQVAHFACHGWALQNDPARSRLALHDHLTAPLTVTDIGALRLKGGLAFLSACDTTISSPRLADEAVHITGAFHLAGYPHVIGTLWRVVDHAAQDIAESFYSHLTDDGTNPPDVSRSAEALHQAVRRLRDRYPATPTYWAAHTHTGI
ncbi:CHAT domain-containing protein [Streptomyces sp. NPDC058092]|uniref:CHAT domain-containing protein n=1 Tax=Streptomyces sp. NPDC058092 TaxID=3346336 RepID=UPI0036E61232